MAGGKSERDGGICRIHTTACGIGESVSIVIASLVFRSQYRRSLTPFSVTRINDVSREDGPRTSFLKMALATSQPSSHLYDEITLTEQFASGLPGDWAFTPLTITQEDNVHFFRKTRAFTLQHFIRLLVARHRFLTLLSGSSGSTPNAQESTEEQIVLEQVTQGI
jgi:hypothetical protein